MTNRGGHLSDERSPLLNANSSNYSSYSAEEEAVPMGRYSSSEEDGGFGNMRAAARQERRVKNNLNLRYDYYEYFVYSQCLPAWLMLLLRFIMGGICVSVFIYITVMMPFVNFVPGNSTNDGDGNTYDNATTKQPRTFKRHFYLCYLTIWSYLIITVYFVTTLVNTVSMWLCSRRQPRVGDLGDYPPFSLTAGGFRSTDNLIGSRGDADAASAGDSGARQVGLRLQWLLCSVAANAALIVTCAYFGVLYPMIKRFNPDPISSVDVLVHGFNTVFMFIEVVFSGVPVRLVHIIYTALYGLTYSLFSLLYWLPDHTNVIYPVLLDWNNIGLTIGMMCLIMFVGLPLIQLVWWLVYLARCFVAGAVLGRDVSWSTGLTV